MKKKIIKNKKHYWMVQVGRKERRSLELRL